MAIPLLKEILTYVAERIEPEAKKTIIILRSGVQIPLPLPSLAKKPACGSTGGL
jgi:hypothetical protein